jgi:hypothetical protein
MQAVTEERNALQKELEARGGCAQEHGLDTCKPTQRPALFTRDRRQIAVCMLQAVLLMAYFMWEDSYLHAC